MNSDVSCFFTFTAHDIDVILNFIVNLEDVVCLQLYSIYFKMLWLFYFLYFFMLILQFASKYL